MTGRVDTQRVGAPQLRESVRRGRSRAVDLDRRSDMCAVFDYSASAWRAGVRPHATECLLGCGRSHWWVVDHSSPRHGRRVGMLLDAAGLSLCVSTLHMDMAGAFLSDVG